MVNTIELINTLILIIMFVLIKINKNSLEIYNWLMLILIAKKALVPYISFTYEQNIDPNIIIVNSTFLFVLTLL